MYDRVVRIRAVQGDVRTNRYKPATFKMTSTSAVGIADRKIRSSFETNTGLQWDTRLSMQSSMTFWTYGVKMEAFFPLANGGGILYHDSSPEQKIRFLQYQLSAEEKRGSPAPPDQDNRVGRRLHFLRYPRRWKSVRKNTMRKVLWDNVFTYQWFSAAHFNATTYIREDDLNYFFRCEIFDEKFYEVQCHQSCLKRYYKGENPFNETCQHMKVLAPQINN